MRRFGYRLILFLLLLKAADLCFLALRPSEPNVFAVISKEKLLKARDYLHSGGRADAIVVGSSHAQFGIDPEAFDRIGWHAYNYAFGGGTSPVSQLEFLRYYLKHATEPPRVVVYAIDVFSLNRDTAATELTFLQHGAAGEPWFKAWAPDRWSSAYLYGGNLLVTARAAAGEDAFRRYDGYEISDRGWVRGRGEANLSFLRYGEVKFTPAVKAVDALNEIMSIARDRSLRLVFVQVPEHRNARSVSAKYDAFSAWAAQHGLTLLDFDREDAFPLGDDSLFFDTDHLNEAGARRFSEILAGKLGESPERGLGSRPR